MIWAVQEERAVIARNLRSAMSAYARSTGRGASLEMGAAGAYCSGLDYAVFNATVLSEPIATADLATALGRAEAFYRHHGVNWSCWLDEAMVSSTGGLEVARLLESLGLRWLAEHEGMIAESIRPAQRGLPAIEVRPVSNGAARTDFLRVCSQVFHLPEATAEAIYGSPAFWAGQMRGWVGYDSGQPVCVAVTALTGDSIGLYSVATMATHRRRGFGESITRHALDWAAADSGVERSILQSTPAGRSLYRRMGYHSRNRISVWTRS